MKKEEYAWMASLEGHFWWYRGMRSIIQSFFMPFYNGKPGVLLDAGCGTGYTLTWMANWLTVTLPIGMDISPEAFRWRVRPFFCPVLANITHFPFRPGSIDILGSFDVLYTLPTLHEVATALQNMHDALAPGGLLLLRVPAFPFLYGAHDKAVGGCRRFRRQPLCRQVETSGLEVLRAGYINTFLFPLAALKRLFHRYLRDTDSSEVRPVPDWLDSFLYAFLALEALLLRWRWLRFPFGLSLLLIARKPTPIPASK